MLSDHEKSISTVCLLDDDLAKDLFNVVSNT